MTRARHEPTVLAVIPARGGSRGVPRKNVRVVAGQPLLAYSITTALAAGERFARVLVSTDDDEIARVAAAYGAEIPLMRPAALADDHAPMVPVLQHAVVAAEAMDGRRIDWICLLQPTAPLRTVADIDACLSLAAETSCDSVISVCRAVATHPALMKRIENGRLVPFCVPESEGTRRQDLEPPAYLRNGAIYLTRRDVLMEHDSIWGRHTVPYEMPDARSLSVDSELDLAVLEVLLRGERRDVLPCAE